MSRLQVGGLALNMQLGNIVTLKFYFKTDQMYSHNFEKINNPWLVIDENHEIKEYVVAEKYLIPIGDKQTQDELLRESELENL